MSGAGDAQLLRLLGESSLRRGESHAATMLLRRAARLAPGQASLKAALGGAYFASGRYERAASALNEALRGATDPGEAHGSLGTMLRLMGRGAEALAQTRKAVALRPGSAEAHSELADVLRDVGEIGDAINAYRRAVALRPDLLTAQFHLAETLTQAGRLTEALAVYQRARALRPNFVETYVRLGRSLLELGEVKSALGQLDSAIAIDPEHAEAHWTRARIHLLAERPELAWADYDWRLRLEAAPDDRFDLPIWDGETRLDGTLLVRAAPTAGETILLARHLPYAAARVRWLVVEGDPGLVRLLGHVAGVAAMGAVPEPVAQLPMVRFPPIVGLGGRATVPYLRLDGPGDEPGGKDLVVGTTSAALAALVARAGVDVRELDPRSEPLELARAIRRLDLLVTDDTLAAHIAGALGQAVWLLLPFVPGEWCWHLARPDSPWYPSARLFRQPRPGDWGAVFAAVSDALDDRLIPSPDTNAENEV
jgi:tetratricopeptide (TPR) repeat protein